MRGAGGHATSVFSSKFEEIERTMGNDIKELMDEMRKMRFRECRDVRMGKAS